MAELSPLTLTGVIFCGTSFVVYGLGCLYSPRIREEFVRYRLERYRQLVGGLQIAGAVGLFGGIWMPALGAAAALGLAILMAMGLGVRIRLRDTALQMAPALIYLLINVYLVVGLIQTASSTG